MRFAVAGATGTAGSRITALARERGHHVAEISRASGEDLLTGEGLSEALAGVDVVVDASNPQPAAPDDDLVTTLSTATRTLIEVSRSAHVQHLVQLSISTIHDPAFDALDYYLAKRAQEQIIAESGFPATIVATTQWHEFATNPAAVTFGEEEVEVQDWLIQPVAVDAVADVLHDSAHSRPARRSLTGPEAIRLPDLTAQLLAAQGDPRPVRSLEPMLPGFAEGALLAPPDAEIIGPTIDAWITSQTR